MDTVDCLIFDYVDCLRAVGVDVFQEFDTHIFYHMFLNTIRYNAIILYCPGPGNSFCSVHHKNIKYGSKERKIQIKSLLKQ